MRWLVVVLAVVGCSRASHDPSWWCWTASKCFATEDDCKLASHRKEPDCTPQATAFCAHGCATGSDGRPHCAPECWARRSSCTDDTARAASCREEPPARHPELFPMYSEPGWWCGTAIVPSGKFVGVCEKGEALCSDMLSHAAGTSITCEQTTGTVYCSAQAGAGSDWVARKPRYWCAPSQATCDQLRALFRDAGSDAGTACAAWAYD
jgi:hypothetical protein